MASLFHYLSDCFDESGELDDEKYMMYMEHQAREDDRFLNWILDRCKEEATEEMKQDDEYQKRKRSPRTVKSNSFLVKDATGNIVQGHPKRMC